MSLIHSTRTAYILITFSHSSLCHFTFLSLFFTIVMLCYLIFFFFFFNDPATPEISPLPLHDALPIWAQHPGLTDDLRRAGDGRRHVPDHVGARRHEQPREQQEHLETQHGESVALAVQERQDIGVEDVDRKSTRPNSSHSQISYAVFCL